MQGNVTRQQENGRGAANESTVSSDGAGAARARSEARFALGLDASRTPASCLSGAGVGDEREALVTPHEVPRGELASRGVDREPRAAGEELA